MTKHVCLHIVPSCVFSGNLNERTTYFIFFFFSVKLLFWKCLTYFLFCSIIGPPSYREFYIIAVVCLSAWHSLQRRKKSEKLQYHLKSQFPPELTLQQSQQNFKSRKKNPSFLFTFILNRCFKRFLRWLESKLANNTTNLSRFHIIIKQYWCFQKVTGKQYHTLLEFSESYYQTILTYSELISNSIRTFTELLSNNSKQFFESLNRHLNKEKILKQKIPKWNEKSWHTHMKFSTKLKLSFWICVARLAKST